MGYDIDRIVTREQEQGWHKGRLITPAKPVGTQPGWSDSMWTTPAKEQPTKVTTDELNEVPKHIIVTTDLEYANKLCEDWYYLKGTRESPEGLQFILQRLTKKRLYEV